MSVVEVTTGAGVQALDVTELVQAAAEIADGVVWVCTRHTTTAVLVNEADLDLLGDLERTAASLLRPLEPFDHARRGNPNASAHLMAALLGRECLVRVTDGALALGEHQRVLLLELDGPKTRRLEVRPLSTASQEVLA